MQMRQGISCRFQGLMIYKSIPNRIEKLIPFIIKIIYNNLRIILPLAPMHQHIA